MPIGPLIGKLVFKGEICLQAIRQGSLEKNVPSIRRTHPLSGCPLTVHSSSSATIHPSTCTRQPRALIDRFSCTGEASRPMGLKCAGCTGGQAGGARTKRVVGRERVERMPATAGSSSSLPTAFPCVHECVCTCGRKARLAVDKRMCVRV